MNLLNKTLITVMASVLFPATVFASNTDVNNTYTQKGYSKPEASPYYTAGFTRGSSSIGKYAGLKVGQTSTEVDKAPKLDDTEQYTVFAGVTIDNNFGFELEHSSTRNVDVTSKLYGKGEYDVAKFGGFVTYRQNFKNKLYLKSKLGLGAVHYDSTYGSTNKSTKDTGIAGGIRVGYDINDAVAVEGEYALYNTKKVSSDSVTLALLAKF